jgi:hypothetical protein
LIDPDIVYGDNTASAQLDYSNLSQLSNKNVDGEHIATLEVGHWVLDGSGILPETSPMNIEVGFVGAPLSDVSGNLSGVWAQINVTNLDSLTYLTIYFSALFEDGYAQEFTVDIYSGATIAYTKTVTDNTSHEYVLSGFKAFNVTAVRVTPTVWSRPYTRARIIEIVLGFYADWEGRDLYSVETYKEVDFSNITLPFGTATIEVNNENRRFDPRNKEGVFEMIESRQPMPIYYGIKLADGAVEWLPAGTYFQQNLGWETEYGGLLMKFSLVDIIGLLRDRKYNPPTTLPTTLIDWVSSIAENLGGVFANKYSVDSTLAGFSLTAAQENIQSITCGELLRLCCMAAGAICYADMSTGNLMVMPPITSEGTSLTLDNLSNYPIQKANIDIDAIVFQLNDGNNTQFVVNGTSTSADTTLSINNFFIKNQTQAQIVARRIIGHYGGQRIESTGRGDLRSEIGDLDSIELYRGVVSGGRLKKQQIKLSNAGIVRDVSETHVQPTGEEIYNTSVVITESGTFTMPAGVTYIRVTLIGGGQGGQGGEIGQSRGDGAANGQGGQGGASGLVWTSGININDGQQFAIVIGQGGAGGGSSLVPGSLGTATTMAPYTSDNGTVYNQMVDIATGNVYASNGVAGYSGSSKNGNPAQNGTGNGGNGGYGGNGAQWHMDSNDRPVTDKERQPGGNGSAGGTGCVIISYDNVGG